MEHVHFGFWPKALYTKVCQYQTEDFYESSKNEIANSLSKLFSNTEQRFIAMM